MTGATINVSPQIPTNPTREGYEALDYRLPSACRIDSSGIHDAIDELRRFGRIMDKLCRVNLNPPQRKVPRSDRLPRGQREYL